MQPDLSEKTYIVVFPFWCDEEVRRFELIARNWRSLTDTARSYSFLLVARCDYDICPATLENLLLEHGSVNYLRCKGPLRYRPSRFPRRHLNANPMFVETAEHIKAAHPEDGAFWLWFEADMMFTDRLWLDKLAKEWDALEDPIALGHIVKDTKHTHLNGAGCYTKNLISLVPKYVVQTTMRDGFDVVLSRYLFKKYPKRVHHSDLWDFRIVKQRDAPADPGTVLLHGCKAEDEFMKRLSESVQPNAVIFGAREPYGGATGIGTSFLGRS